MGRVPGESLPRLKMTFNLPLWSPMAMKSEEVDMDLASRKMRPSLAIVFKSIFIEVRRLNRLDVSN